MSTATLHVSDQLPLTFKGATGHFYHLYIGKVDRICSRADQ
jgi:hypothetical protein